jgi:hypothetical protein
VITQEDIEVGRRMARKYRGHRRFSEEDAFQAAMEHLIKRDPKDRGLRVLEMRKGIAEEFTRSAFPVVIPRSSFDRMKKRDGRPPEISGDLIVDERVFEYMPHHEGGYQDVEDVTTAHQMLAGLDKDELRVVLFFIEGRRFPYQTRIQDKRLLEQTLERMRHEFAQA